MPNFDHIFDAWPAWLALATTGLLAVNRLIEESSKFAERLGGWAVKINQRAKVRHQIDLKAAEFGMAITDAIEKARRSWESDENEALRALDARLETVTGISVDQKRDIDEMRRIGRVSTAYQEYEAMWHGRLTRSMAGVVDCIPLESIPRHLDYWEFEKRFGNSTDWRVWGFSEEIG